MEKKQKSNLEIKNPLSAGIDVGASQMQVCVPPSVDNDFNRSFGTTTSDLKAIADWLTGNGITHAAMEATGVYWIPLFNILLRKGITVVLLNAADVKNYTARKTDVNDAE
ncbi:MAG: transposase [Muribaculaceae bacterium]|nr:transposase [Muribaculaceae bacterium]